MCAHNAPHAETGFFLQFVIVVVLLMYLVYMKRVVRVAAIFEDKSMVTTGDYSVLLRGLKDGLGAPSDERVTADELKALVYADLKQLGFKRDRIAQVEVGRTCGEEIKLLQRLEKLNIEKHELAAREVLRQQGKLKASTKAKDTEATLKLAKEIAEVVGRTKELYDMEDYATGHAFVVFQYEADRNRFIRLARRPMVDGSDLEEAAFEEAAAADAEADADVHELELPPMWKVMKLDGLDGIDEEFKVQLADRSGAENLSRLRGCTKKLVKLDGEGVAPVSETDILSLLGHPLQSMETLTAFPRRGENLDEYGCSVAVTLYLRFQWETAMVFVMLFVISLVQFSDNKTRGDFRNREPPHRTCALVRCAAAGAPHTL